MFGSQNANISQSIVQPHAFQAISLQLTNRHTAPLLCVLRESFIYRLELTARIEAKEMLRKADVSFWAVVGFVLTFIALSI